MGRIQNVFFNCVNSKGHSVQYGIPQMSFGPLWFVVYINDHACHLDSVSISMYANVRTIMYFHKNLKYFTRCFIYRDDKSQHIG